MAISKEIKIDMLLDSFEILKGNYVENRFQLKDIIVQMFDCDEEIGLKIWKQLIKENMRHLKSTDNASFFLCSYPFDEIKKLKGIEFCVNLIMTDSFIKESLLLNNGDYPFAISDILVYLANNKNYSCLYDILLLTTKNKYCDVNYFEKAIFSVVWALGDQYKSLKDKIEYYSQDLMDFLYKLSSRHLTGVSKAKFDIELLYEFDEIEREKAKCSMMDKKKNYC